MPFGCKLCILNDKLSGTRFREGADWFSNEDDLLTHMHATRPDARWVSKNLPSWPGILEDAQACAEGYLICCHDAECERLEFTSFRCNATSIHVNDINNRHCLSCGRRYQNFYSRFDKPTRSGNG